MNFLDLFSGIGGFRLGAEWAGLRFDKEYHSDIDEYANKVYVKHFPGSIQLGDITKIDFEKLKDGNEFIITGGFPCQDISIAGKGEGIEGSRSGLWSEMFRAIRVLRPRSAIIENVSAITFRGLDRVLSDLAEIGYDAEWQDIRAEDMGAPHRRERIWIVAYSRYLCRGNQEQKAIRESEENWLQRNQVAGSGEARNVADTESRQSGQQTERERRENISGGSQEVSSNVSYTSKSGLEREKPERGNGRKPGLSPECGQWSVEPSICRVVNGLPNRSHRLRCLGNSIVPQIAELLFRQIKDKL